MTDSMQQMALDTLGAYFGYTSFRPGQDRMVDAILAGRDALGVMPTGAGKSICYQVPALMLPGITFVVSPLLSLMEDQTRALLAAGARPSYLNSSLTPAQQNTVLKRAREGRYQLMYVAPERLLEPRFLAFAQEAAADGGIGVPLVAIDEAHCVSQWGQDFRPAYLQIREFIDSLPQRPIVAAFTATATERVRADIQQMLGLQNPATVVTGFDRKNLYFGCEEMGDKAKTAWVRDYVIAHSSESGIVYCSTRKTVDALAGELAEALGPSGIRVGRYHAGMGNDARRQSQRAFIDDDIQVMVATNAFGMGIDKPNVRYVIHNNVPESIEAYYQEAGRARRAVDLLREEAELDQRPRVGDDAELFERLRALRKEISTELEMAPYMVFSDKALRGLCRLRPQTRDELIQVNGIGEKKADAFGEQFMVAIEEFESEHARDGA